jgi:hypothetical protein
MSEDQLRQAMRVMAEPAAPPVEARDRILAATLRRRSMRRRGWAVAGAAATVAVVGGVAWAQGPSGDARGSDPAPQASSTPTTSQTPTSPPCGTPARPILDWAAEAVATHPGPIVASTMVRAATTDTGTWYVVGIHRAHVLDDGTLTGSGSRSFALTNATGPRAAMPDGTKMIPIGASLWGQDVRFGWGRVSWRGETLDRGRRAAETAVACLDRLHTEGSAAD